MKYNAYEINPMLKEEQKYLRKKAYYVWAQVELELDRLKKKWGKEYDHTEKTSN